MKKTLVIYSKRDGHVPFFRGILVKSLVNIGISFDDAYELANVVRDELREVPSISTDDLVDRVAGLIENRFGVELRERFELMHGQNARILVHNEQSSECFSLGVLRHSLRACAIPKDTAAAGAIRVEEILRGGGHLR